MKDYGLAVSTEKANIAVSTAACSFLGVSLWASAACTITIVDSGKTIMGPYNIASGATFGFIPPVPIACTAGLSATNSGGGYYTIFYGNK
jgi:hypothetical protein